MQDKQTGGAKRSKGLLFIIFFLFISTGIMSQVMNTHNITGVKKEVQTSTAGSYGMILKYNPTNGRWTAQLDSLAAFAASDSIALGYLRAKNDTLYIYDKNGWLVTFLTTEGQNIPDGIFTAAKYDSTEAADGTRFYSFTVTNAKDPAAEITGLYSAVNKQNGSNGVYTINAIEGVARSSYADQAGTFRGGMFRTYTSPGATASMRTAVGLEASARAGYSGGTDCVAEVGTAFVGSRVWMAPYFTSASLANMTNFWGLWIYGEHTTQINGDAAIKIGTAGGKFTVDLNLQNGETISNNTDGTVAISGIIADGSANTSTQWTAGYTHSITAQDSSNFAANSLAVGDVNQLSVRLGEKMATSAVDDSLRRFGISASAQDSSGVSSYGTVWDLTDGQYTGKTVSGKAEVALVFGEVCYQTLHLLIIGQMPTLSGRCRFELWL